MAKFWTNKKIQNTLVKLQFVDVKKNANFLVLPKKFN